MKNPFSGLFGPKDPDAPPKKRIGAVTGTRILKVADKGLLVAFIGAIIAVYILDAIFFMAWAPSMWLVPVFFLIGVVIRSTGVFTGPIMQVAAKDKTTGRETKTIRSLSIAAGILCLIPALSFFAGGHYNQTHESTVAAATEIVSDDNKASRIATIHDQVLRIEQDRDAAVAEANNTIKLIADDGVPGISNADNVSIAGLRAEIRGYRDKATSQITVLNAQISNIEQEKETVQSDAAEAKTKVSPAYAIFLVLGTMLGSAEGWAMTILFLFAILVEAIAFFGLGAYQGLHRFFIEAIQTMELNEEAHEARLAVEAQRIKDKIAAESVLERANADLELAAIEVAARKAKERADAARAGEDPELHVPLKAAEADLKAATVEEQAAKLRAEADAIRARKPAPIIADPVDPIVVDVEEEVVTEKPPPQDTDAQRWGREGGKQAALNRKAEEARKSRILVIGPVSTLDQLKVAAE